MSVGLRANEPLVVFADCPKESTCKKCDISQLSIPHVERNLKVAKAS